MATAEKEFIFFCEDFAMIISLIQEKLLSLYGNFW